MPGQAYTNTYSRVWLIEGGAGPGRPRSYHGSWKAGAVSWDRGDITTIREPDPNRYNSFIRVGRYRGEPGDPEMPITARYTFQRSRLMRMARQDCEHTLQVHMGQCENPQDFPRGWEKTLILENASINSYGTEDLGALGPDENAPVNEEVPFVGTDIYEVVRLTFAEMATTLVSAPISSVYVCDSAQCGACGVASDGCQVVLALQAAVPGSPGPGSGVLYTTNGGGTWAAVPGPAGVVVDKLYCSGDLAVVLSDADDAMFFTDLSDLTIGVVNWTRVDTGFVTGQGPLAAWSLGANETWIVGTGGAIYFSSDPGAGVELNNNSATSNDLNDVHATDSLNVVAVGAANTVVATANGGISWSSVVGPAPGAVLTSVWMRSPQEWLVGTATGHLYYTINGGATWTEKSFTGAGSGSVGDIVFATPSVGYVSHVGSTGAGRVLRTIDGGFSWYVLPEGAGTIPANTGIDVLAVCDDPNILYAGGSTAGGGILLKAA